MLEWSTSFYDADGYDVWREEINNRGLQWSLDKKVDKAFSATDRILPFSNLAIYDCKVGCFGGQRVRRDIKASTRAVYDLVMIKEGVQFVEHDGINTKVVPGQMLLWDTEKECRVKVDKATSYQAVAIPKDVVHSLTRYNPLQPRIIDGHTGFGAVVNACISTAIANAQDFSGGEQDRFEEMLLGLIVQAFHSEKPVRLVSGKENTLKRVKAYINDQLADTELSPGKVADALGISVRYIHLLFKSDDITFNRYLYRARLRKIQRELNGRTPSEVSLTQLAHYYGFKDASHFSRIFKKEVGMSPSEYRKQRNW